MFIPLGGAKYKVFSLFVIFTFVAIWHDIGWKLITWAWGIYAVFAPEVAIKSYFR